MRMIPSSPSKQASYAERKVFYALKNSSLSKSTICLHSLGLPQHAYKACCELDFVILGPEGLYALEVKGGGVSRGSDGMWSMTDRMGQEHRHREGPFRQVQGNFFALQDQLKKYIPLSELKSIPKGWGVLFPDCKFSVTSVEWDSATMADQRWMQTLAPWLENFIRYYRKKAGYDSAYQISPDVLHKIMAVLRPQFEQVPSLAGAVDSAEMVLASLTEDQCHAVDILAANPRVLCSGGAGTGKTFMALELVRRSLAEDRKVTLCCASPWLRHFLDARVSHPSLQVLSISQARRTIGRASPSDVLIVDEGQDLMNMDDLDVLDQMVLGGLSGGIWAFFYDSNNQTGLVGRWDPNALEYLQSLGAMSVPLNRNCRNTSPIVEEVAKRTGCLMGHKDQGEGPQVEFIEMQSGESPEDIAGQVIAKLLNCGVLMSQITILSPRPWAESSASRLSGRIAREVVQLDEFSMRDFPPSRISFARIQDFKGLENTAIIMLDLDKNVFAQHPPSLLYVGMSRARAYLALLAVGDSGNS